MRRLGRFQRKAVRYHREAMRRWRRTWRARVGQATGVVQAGVVQTGRQGPGERAAHGVSEAPRVGSGRRLVADVSQRYEDFELKGGVAGSVEVGSVGCTATY